MDTKDLIQEIEEGKEFLDEHEQKFVESVCEFYYEKGFISDSQREWLEIYCKKISSQIEPHEYLKHPDEENFGGKPMFEKEDPRDQYHYE
jgi:hypothetical protein